MSDKQDAFVTAIAAEFPGTPHRYCANHSLRDIAAPMLAIERMTRQCSGKTCKDVTPPECMNFVYLSSLEMDCYSIFELTACGRLRWTIENEGFDVQKHHGYGLGHQFSRKSMVAIKNYYHLMQIAHLINQLFELSSLLAEVRRSKESLEHIRSCLVGELRHEVLELAVLETILARRIRIRYD